MSIWTHINGCIRVDGIPDLHPTINQEVKDILGNTCNFESEESEWAKCSVPCGSEGSVQYEILKVGDGFVLYTIPIWGDLRDYEDGVEIKKWFDEIMNSSLMIRGAVLEYKIDREDSVVLKYESDAP